MMLYKRYIAKEVAAAVLLVLVAFIALFSFFDLIGELRDVGKGGYKIQHALAFIALRIPARIYELMPIAMLIGALYALSTLARHSEITVLRASGLSTGGLLKTLLQIAGVFAVLTLITGEVIAPPLEKVAKQVRLTAIGKLVSADFRTGLWVKDDMNFINVRQVTPDGQLRSIRIYEFNKNAELVAVREAEAWVLADREGFATFAGIPANKISSTPESLSDPKQELINLVRRSRNKRLAAELVPVQGSAVSIGPLYNERMGQFVREHWNVDAAIARSPSLERTFARLQTFMK